MLRVYLLQKNAVAAFTYLKVAKGIPVPRLPVLCIGPPGKDDLEAEENKKMECNLFEISEGMCRWMVRGKDPVDPPDNGRIGAFVHDAWTYWAIRRFHRSVLVRGCWLSCLVVGMIILL